jgi:DNA/RNA endonuclease YhcR with UshA esterase domain
MRTKLVVLVAAGLALFCSAVPVVAHHSFAVEYDVNKAVTVKGAVTKFEWTNPHAHVYVDVVDEKGVVTHWNFEMASPNILERNGWSRRVLNVGDKVTLKGFSGRVDATRGIVNSITLADGRALFAGAGPGAEYAAPDDRR